MNNENKIGSFIHDDESGSYSSNEVLTNEVLYGTFTNCPRQNADKKFSTNKGSGKDSCVTMINQIASKVLMHGI